MKFPPFSPPTNPLGMIIKVMSVILLSLSINREIRDIQKEKREQAKEDK